MTCFGCVAFLPSPLQRGVGENDWPPLGSSESLLQHLEGPGKEFRDLLPASYTALTTLV